MPSFEQAERPHLEAAIAVTLNDGFGHSHSLCHGDLGNIDLLIEARLAGMPQVTDAVLEHYGTGVLEGIRQNGWICGTPKNVETPGLMSGLAGIGYGFLRLYDPQKIPSILLLDPPSFRE